MRDPRFDNLQRMLAANDFAAAERLCREALRMAPQVESARLGLAHALKGQGRLDEARSECRRFLQHSPNNPGALHLLATIHAGQVDYAPAIDLLRRAVAVAPREPLLHLTLAGYLLVTGRPDEALAAFDAGLSLRPDAPRGRMGRLQALRYLGRTEEVVAGYRDCIARGICVSEAWWSLSSLRTHVFSDEDLEHMQGLRAAPQLADVDAVFLDFALGKAMDDRQRYDDAWGHYVSGNAGRRKIVDWDREAHERHIDAIMDCFDADAVARAASDKVGSTTPVFVVGMPRSGSTLVEQVLASHSAVESTTELPYLAGLGESLVRAWLGGKGTGTAAATRIGEQYLRNTEMHRRERRPNFVDKQPDNFLYAGLIFMALPGARVIDVRRDPLDTCVGNFRQWFGQGKAFTYDLADLAHYYLQYRRLMRHWNEVIPGRILEVRYEDLVEDTESQVRRILEYCGLPWEPGCLEFHSNRRAITSASSEQVRQPIYRSAIGFWTNYERHLAELRELLDAVLP